MEMLKVDLRAFILHKYRSKDFNSHLRDIFLCQVLALFNELLSCVYMLYHKIYGRIQDLSIDFAFTEQVFITVHVQHHMIRVDTLVET